MNPSMYVPDKTLGKLHVGEGQKRNDEKGRARF
jgi:hypothetical protein